jgi:hypothetical protein
VDAQPSLHVVTRQIPNSRVQRLRHEVGALNRRAARLGVKPYTLTVSEPYAVPRPPRNAREQAMADVGAFVPRMIEVVDVRIEGERIKLSGWALLARVDFLVTEDGEVIPVFSRTPDAQDHDDLLSEHGITSRCDHCRVVRARKQVYVMRHDSGETKIVGSTCLADFLGHKSPHAVLDLATAVAELCSGGDDDELDRYYERGDVVPDLVTYLTVVAATIRAYGWTSRREAYDRDEVTSTADLAWTWLNNPSERRKLEIAPGRSDKAAALLARRWACRLKGESDYEHNAQALARAGYVPVRLMGIAASIVAVWQREQEKRRRLAKVKPDASFGTPGKRVVLDVEVLGILTVDGYYGTKDRVTMVETGSGAMVVWWASGRLPQGMCAGALLRVKATIKKHESYKGTMQTLVQRLVEA